VTDALLEPHRGRAISLGWQIGEGGGYPPQQRCRAKAGSRRQPCSSPNSGSATLALRTGADQHGLVSGKLDHHDRNVARLSENSERLYESDNGVLGGPHRSAAGGRSGALEAEMAQRRIDFLSLMYKKSSDPGILRQPLAEAIAGGEGFAAGKALVRRRSLSRLLARDTSGAAPAAQCRSFGASPEERPSRRLGRPWPTWIRCEARTGRPPSPRRRCGLGP
jgi:hypothetical protein